MPIPGVAVRERFGDASLKNIELLLGGQVGQGARNEKQPSLRGAIRECAMLTDYLLMKLILGSNLSGIVPMMNSKLNRRDFLALSGATAAAAAMVGNSGRAASSPPSKKKGLGVVTNKDGKWLERVKALNAKWFYSWGANLPDGVPEKVDFVPMIWGGFGQKGKQTLDEVKQLGKDGKVHYLLGFNEPDGKDQSNLAVDKAVELWPQLMETGLPLASPACVHPDRDWMKEFFREVDKRKLRVDYIAVHSYAGPDASGLVNHLHDVHQMFGKRPIVLTEFAVGDWSAKSVEQNKHSAKQVAQFMRDVLPLLDKADFVHGYAWFSASQKSAALGTSALFDELGELTELGKIYAAT